MGKGGEKARDESRRKGGGGRKRGGIPPNQKKEGKAEIQTRNFWDKKCS